MKGGSDGRDDCGKYNMCEIVHMAVSEHAMEMILSIVENDENFTCGCRSRWVGIKG